MSSVNPQDVNIGDAFNFLIQVRGDALDHDFKLFKDAVKHLDPKSRDLISVITKVGDWR